MYAWGKSCFSVILDSTMKIPSAEWSSRVLRLYRQLLKEGKSLQYTDYEFFRRTIRREFDQQRDELEIKVIKKQYEKGAYFLKSKLGGLQ